eukprot:gene2401-2968_t
MFSQQQQQNNSSPSKSSFMNKRKLGLTINVEKKPDQQVLENDSNIFLLSDSGSNTSPTLSPLSSSPPSSSGSSPVSSDESSSSTTPSLYTNNNNINNSRF